jgi:SAM-dependent methyltransferase
VRSLRLIPEAARLLRPGGQLIFLANSALLMLAVPDEDDQPATDRLLRPYFGMHRFEWPDEEPVEFHLGHGEMIRLLRGAGLEVDDLLELRPDPDATTRYPFVTLEWARQWPSEEVWKARKAWLNRGLGCRPPGSAGRSRGGMRVDVTLYQQVRVSQ